MITRRNFLKISTLASASVILLPGCLKFARDRNGIGLQLYTVRDHIDKDLKGTLEEVSRIGYNYLEAAGYSDGKFYGLQPKEFRRMAEDMGMKLISSHVAIKSEQSQQAIDAHLELGVPYAVYPWMSMPEKPSREDYVRKAELFNNLGQACKHAGLKFGYHNHDFEFVKIEDTTGYDILMERCDPDLVFFEADIYWMTYAHVDPLTYLKKYKGRYKLWHVKDMEDSAEREFTEVGEGTIPYEKYFDEADGISGMKYFFIEQDACKIDSLKSAAISFTNLVNILKN